MAKEPSQSSDIELPFKSLSFMIAWIDWKQHRTECKKKLTPTSIKMQFKRLAAMGEARAIAAIEHSIANGYQGIFEPASARLHATGTDRAATYLAQGAAVSLGDEEQ